jgi:hypothetical protein
MLEEYFWTAYYPIGPESQRPMTGTNEVNVPGIFGDIFDVVYAYPDVSKWRTIDTYPVVILAGDIELTRPEGERLAAYVESGGTLLVTDGPLSGPGVAALKLPNAGELKEADHYRWHLGHEAPASEALQVDAPPSKATSIAPRFRYRPIQPDQGKILATTDDGDILCTMSERGHGRLIFWTVPRGLSIGKQAHPMLARLIAHLSRGLMPIEVDGDVQWLLNRTNAGWAVTLINPAGQQKPQQGITPTDFRENRAVRIRSKVPIESAIDLLLPSDTLNIREGSLECEVPAGGVRIIRLK